MLFNIIIMIIVGLYIPEIPIWLLIVGWVFVWERLLD